MIGLIMAITNNQNKGQVSFCKLLQRLLNTPVILISCLLLTISCTHKGEEISLEKPLGGPPKFSERLQKNLTKSETLHSADNQAQPENLEGETASTITSSEAKSDEPKTPLIYYSGTKGAIAGLDVDDADLDDKTLQLNFVNAPAQDVARTIINQALGQPLAIAENVTGQITLSAPEPVPAKAALDALEAALAESGLALLHKPSGYILTTLQRAGEASRNVRGNETPIGFGATIIPIDNTSPSAIIRLIEPFTSNRLNLSANDDEGILTLSGPQSDIREAINAIETFDTPFLTDRIFGLFELTYTDPVTIHSEVEAIMSSVGGANSQFIDFIPLERLNLLFVAARNQKDFGQARQWIERFDQPSESEERHLRYLHVKNTDATVLAQQLSAALGFRGGGFNSSSPSSNGNNGSSIRNGSANSSRNGTGNGRQGFGSGNSRENQNNSRSVPNTTSSGGGSGGNGASIVADELNNALIIRASDLEFQEIETLIERMDILAPQVLIEATIAEVTLNDDLRFGVRWFFENAESTATLSDNVAGAIGPVFPGFSYTFIDNSVEASIDALASVTDVSILSAPSLMVQNNQSANLQVGDEVPIVTQTAQGTIDGNAPIVSNVQLRETGIILEVTPRINAGDVVVIDVSQEVSSVVNTTSSGIDSPTIQQRRIASTVAVQDNATVVLGGLIQETYTNNNSGIPLLKDVPYLGHAFKSRDITKNRTEIIVFLTTRIIRDEQDNREVLHRLRGEMGLLFERLEGDVGKPASEE